MLAVGIAIGVVITATPAASHVGGTVAHLWSHLKPLTDARYALKTREAQNHAAQGAAIGQQASALSALDAREAANHNQQTSALNALDAREAANHTAQAAQIAQKQNRCETGSVLGFAHVDASPTFSSSYVNVGFAFNCTGGAVQARRVGAGSYIVRFSGNPAALAVVSSTQVAARTSVATINDGGLAFQVVLYEGSYFDGDFTILLP